MITIVSGLPRSGTSMMMHMLERGGLPLLEDGHRAADENNPKGYFEFEQVKQIKVNAGWLTEAEGKAIKIISQHLLHLPTDRDFKIIFMTRDMEEILDSQEAMLERAGKQGAKISREGLAMAFTTHIDKVTHWLQAQANMDVSYTAYADVIRDPLATAREVSAFLGCGLDAKAMAGGVDSTLYRQRR